MAQPYQFDGASLRSAPGVKLPVSGVSASRGILFGIALSLPFWAFILWLLF